MKMHDYGIWHKFRDETGHEIVCKSIKDLPVDIDEVCRNGTSAHGFYEYIRILNGKPHCIDGPAQFMSVRGRIEKAYRLYGKPVCHLENLLFLADQVNQPGFNNLIFDAFFSSGTCGVFTFDMTFTIEYKHLVERINAPFSIIGKCGLIMISEGKLMIAMPDGSPRYYTINDVFGFNK